MYQTQQTGPPIRQPPEKHANTDTTVSEIRQVPDNQEVYLAADGLSSLVFDLGERVTDQATDEAALRFHFDDIVDEGDEKVVWEIRRLEAGKESPGMP